MKRFLRAIITVAGAVIGPGMVLLVFEVLKAYLGDGFPGSLPPLITTVIFAGSAVVFGILFFFLSEPIAAGIVRLSGWAEKKSLEQPARVTFIAMGGLVLGLIAAFIISQIISGVELLWFKAPISAFIYVVCGYIFMRIATICGKKLYSKKKGDEVAAVSNVVDTSAIIDGRLLDIYNTGLIEGKLIIPQFVLDELRHIADSDDPVRRGKGRKALDMLELLKDQKNIKLEISSSDYENIEEVDAKLLKLAGDRLARIITTDYNLNKIASVNNIRILNINDVANAVKPVLTAGEKLSLTVIKQGKDSAQGIGYLDDGTMIVVENGRQYIGQTISAEVTSLLQTSAGRMIFVKHIED